MTTRTLKFLRTHPVTILGSLVLLALNVGMVWDSSLTVDVLAPLLQFDRDAIGRGEWWRLFTGQLVHWSWSHYWLDSSVFLIQGLIVEHRFHGRYGAALGVGFAMVGLALWGLQPDLTLYRGLSGVVNTQFIFGIALMLVDHKKGSPMGYLARGLACVYGIKTGYELLANQLFFPTPSLGEMGTPTPLAHGAGAVAGLVVLLLCSHWRTVGPLPNKVKQKQQAHELN